MSGRIGAGVDILEMISGLFGTAVNVSSVKSEMKKLRPEISKLLQKNAGVLVVMRSEVIQHISTTTTQLASIEIMGAGNRPEPLVSKPRMYPQKHKHQQMEETFVWILYRKNMNSYFNRPPGYYAGTSAEIKVMPFEEI